MYNDNVKIDIFVNGPHLIWLKSKFENEQSIKIVSFENRLQYFSSNFVTEHSLDDVAFSIHWPQKFDEKFLNSYKYALNIHPGYLPIGRGTYPIFWNILENTKAGVTVHQMTSEIDSGPVLLRQEINYGVNDSSGDLWNEIHKLEKSLILKTIQMLLNETTLEFYVPKEPKGILRKKSEFLQILNEPPKHNLTPEQLKRLKLAFTHHDYDLPEWINNFKNHDR